MLFIFSVTLLIIHRGTLFKLLVSHHRHWKLPTLLTLDLTRLGTRKYFKWRKYFIEMFVSSHRQYLECQLLREHQHSSTEAKQKLKKLSKILMNCCFEHFNVAFLLILFFMLKCPEFCKILFVTGF